MEGAVFQNYALFPTMTVKANIAAGLKGTKLQKSRRVEEMVKKFQLEDPGYHQLLGILPVHLNAC